MKRQVFIVGFPRSGTTLLQTILMCDPVVYSAPETHAFDLAPKAKGWKRFFPAAIRINYHATKWIYQNYGAVYFSLARTRSDALKSFINKVSTLALEKQPKGEVFLEKTPDHLCHLGEIRELFPDAKILHIIRNRKKAVDSFIKAGEYWTVDNSKDFSNKKWFSALSETCYEIATHGDLLVKYEDLVNDLPSVVEYLNRELELNIDFKTINKNIKNNAKEVVSKGEVWKSNNLGAGVVSSGVGGMQPDEILDDFINIMSSISN